MKKILSLIMVVAFVLSSVPTVYAQDSDIEIKTYDKEVNLLKTLEIINYSFEPKQLISRGEFAELITELSGTSVDSLNEPVQMFYDVPVTHKYFQYISFCARRNCMSGYDGKMFSPDNKILAEEAVATLVKFLGYGYLAKANGDGYTGYIAAAREIGLLKGISLPYGKCIFYEEAAKLIYNALEIPLMMVNGISNGVEQYLSDPSKTPLALYHKKAKITGLVTATDLTGIKGYSASEEGSFVVGGHTFYTNNNLVRRYLGYDIEVLYSIEEGEENKCIEIYPEKDVDKYDINGSDFIGIISGKFSYTDENDNTQNISLSPSVDFIYNGKLTMFDKSIIDNVNYGHFEVIRTSSSSQYDVVIFNEYKTFVVDKVTTSRYVIQGDSLVQGDGNLVLSYDPEVYEFLLVGEDGDIVAPENLNQNDVITYYVSGNYIIGYVTHNEISGFVTSKNDSEKEVYINDTIYVFAGDKDLFYSSVHLNDEITVYLDYMGNIAGFRSSDISDGGIITIPIKLAPKTVQNENVLLLKLYDVNDGIIKEVYLDSKIKLDGIRLSDAYTASSQIQSALFSSTAGTPAMVKYNSDNEIIEIDTPKALTDFSDDEDGFTTLLDAKSTYYHQTNKNFGNKAFGTSYTKYLLIPDDLQTAESEDFYKVAEPSSSDTRVVYAYTNSKNNKYATLVMHKKSSYFKLASSASAVVIKRITKTLSEYGEDIIKIYYEVDGTEKFCYSDNPDLQDAFKPTSTQNYYQEPVYIKDLQPGDIISIGLDGDGFIVSYKCLWKSDKSVIKSNTQALSKYRFVEATVKSIDTKFLTLETHINTSSSTYNDLENYIYDSAPVTILRGNGTSKVTVEKGSIADLVPGDTVLVQALKYSLTRVFLIK